VFGLFKLAASAAILSCMSGGVSAQPTLSANVTTVQHMDWVRVTYSNLSPSTLSSVFFAVFYPSTANLSAVDALPYPATAPFLATAAFSWILCTDMPGCSTGNGNGVWDFNMINTLKGSAIIAAFTDLNKPALIATTEPITFTDTKKPINGHLSRTAYPEEMLVVWHSAENEPDAQVKWSFTSGGPYTFSAPSIPHSYDKEDLCGYPTSVATSVGWSDPLTWHYARITGLTPGGDIVYYVYGSDTNGYSTELSFKPAPPVQAKQSLPIHIIAIADMGMTPYDGTQNHWQEPDAGLTTDHMRDFVQSGTGYDYSIVLHPGDIVYSTGYALKWDLFTSRIEGVADRVPYMLGQGYVFIVILLLVSIHLTLFSLPPSLSPIPSPTPPSSPSSPPPSNHERDWPGSGSYISADSGGECGLPTTTRFPAPYPAGQMQDEGYYQIAHGSSTIIMLNTELQMGPGSDQYVWLEQTLTAVDRTITPWVIVLGHRPTYFVSDSKAGGERDPAFAVFEPLLYTYKVDLYLVGHVHNAFVSCPMVNSTCVTASSPGAYDAPIYACIGNAGQGISPINTTHYPEWVKYQRAEWGYSSIHIWNETDLSMDFHDDSDGSLQYTFGIKRTFPRT